MPHMELIKKRPQGLFLRIMGVTKIILKQKNLLIALIIKLFQKIKFN